MFRAVVYSSLAALGLAPPLATPNAQAHPPVIVPHCASYRVLYRTCHREPWRPYAAFASEHAARHAERRLLHEGYNVRVVLD